MPIKNHLAVLTLILTPSAYATIGMPTITPVPIPAGTLINQGGGTTLDNFVSQDLVVNTTADWTGGALVLELTSGTIYQDASGSELAPNPLLLNLPQLASLRYDTFVTNPDGTEVGGGAFINGSAGDLNDLSRAFDGARISLSWGSPGADTNDIGDNPIARITLSDDAQGFWSLAVTEKNNRASKFLSNPIVNGQMISDPLQGDLNFDGFVGIEDLNRVLEHWNQNVAVGDRTTGDPSGDGFVGIEDLNTVFGNWNAGFMPPPSVTPGLIERDYNGDGFVGIDDQNIVLSHWNENVTPGDQTKGDSDGDGFIGISDMAYRNWNAGTPPIPAPGGAPPAVVPEPAGLAVIGLGFALCLRHRQQL